MTVDEPTYNFGDVPKHLARKLAEERAAEEGPATAAVTVPGMTGAARQYADGDTWPYGAGGPLDAPEGENCD